MPKQQNKKVCFIIAPIGEEGSEVRRRSDQVLKHIIAPATKDCGYNTIRADKISEPGMITSQVIQHLVEDPLIIADLTSRNPNVFYELAIRHAIRKPVVQLIQMGESIPFDVAQSRTIQVDHHDLDSVARCKEELRRQIQSVEKDPTDVDTPLSVAIDLKSLRQSENPLETGSAEIIAMVQDLRSKVKELGDMYTHPRMNRMMFEEFFMLFDRLATMFDLAEGEKVSRSKFNEAQDLLRRLERTVHVLMIDSGLPPDIVEDFMEKRLRRERRLSRRKSL